MTLSEDVPVWEIRVRPVFNKSSSVKIHVSHWRRRSESNEVFTDYQPQYPDLQGYFTADFTGVQAVYGAIGTLPDLTRHIPTANSVIEEIVEGFVEAF